MLRVIGVIVLASSLVLVLLQNFKTSEMVLERKVEPSRSVPVRDVRPAGSAEWSR